MDILSRRFTSRAYHIVLMSLDITQAELLLASPAVDDVTESTGISDRSLWIMAAACGTAAANIYYNQPLLGDFAAYFHATVARADLVATAAQVGYGTGIFFFVPLGDLVDRRKLVLTLTGICCLLLVGIALSPSLWLLIFFQLLVAIAAVSAQVLIPLAIDLSPPPRRGHTVGILMAGLLMGILLARTVSGFVSDWLSWRAMYYLASGIMLMMWFILRASLPHRTPSLKMSYPRLLHSMIELLQTQPQLWVASIVSGLTFGGFMAFWTALSSLMKEHFHRGASEAGLFGIVGIAGAMAAPLAGKMSDRRGPRFTVTIAVLSSAVAFMLMGWSVTIPGLIVGVLLMDMGVQSVQVAEQATVMALVPEARSRINTLYMVARFLGGAGGSALTAAVWPRHGWAGVSAVCVGLMIIAMAVHLIGSTNPDAAENSIPPFSGSPQG